MSKKVKVIIAVVLVLGAAFGVYLYIKNKKKKEEEAKLPLKVGVTGRSANPVLGPTLEERLLTEIAEPLTLQLA